MQESRGKQLQRQANEKRAREIYKDFNLNSNLLRIYTKGCVFINPFSPDDDQEGIISILKGMVETAIGTQGAPRSKRTTILVDGYCDMGSIQKEVWADMKIDVEVTDEGLKFGAARYAYDE